MAFAALFLPFESLPCGKAGGDLRLHDYPHRASNRARNLAQASNGARDRPGENGAWTRLLFVSRTSGDRCIVWDRVDVDAHDQEKADGKPRT